MGSKNFCRLAIIGFLAIPSVLLAWPIPDTGQTKCYDEVGTEIDCAGTGQDGEFLINPPSYTKLDANGNELDDTATEWVMVRDNVTGLIWEVKTDDGSIHDKDNQYTWYCPDCPDNGGEYGTPGDGTDTQDFIDALNAGNGFGGFTDWRLPTMNELRQNQYYGAVPLVNRGYFPHDPNRVWSSSTLANDATKAWNISSSTVDGNNSKWSPTRVRAVRGGQAKLLGHLVINDNGTVTDARTGLMWQRKAHGEMNWEESLNNCKTMTDGGHDDWRLPTIHELVSIVELDRYYPAIEEEYFQRDLSSWGINWTSTTRPNFTQNAMSPEFFRGIYFWNDKVYQRFTLPVRGGQNQISGDLVIQEPRQASFWNVNSTLPITWDTVNIPGNVEISISYAGGRPGTYQTMAASTPNDGEYDWVIEPTSSFNCMLKIEPLSDPDKGTVQGLFSILGYLQANPASLGLQEPALPDDTPESKTFAIRLASDPGGDLELELASANPTECVVSPASVTLNSANWDTGVTVAVTPEYDGVADGDQMTSLLASTVDPLGAFQAVDLPLVQVIVQDSDVRTTLQSVSPAFGEAGQPLTVTADGTNFTSSTSI